jgi:hypothetical protein
MPTSFEKELAKLPQEVRPVVASVQALAEQTVGVIKDRVNHPYLGFEMMAQGFAMATGSTIEEARDAMAIAFTGALQGAVRRGGHSPGHA